MTKKVYILGGSQTDYERNWSKEGKNTFALLKEVIEDTLGNTNITYSEITKLNSENKIACYVGNFIAEKYTTQGHLGALLTEIHPAFYGVPSARFEAACASGSVAVDAAMTKIQNGDYDMAIVVGYELMKTVDSKIGADYLGMAALYEKEAKEIDFPFPKLFAQLADQTINKYNLDEKRYLDSLAIISDINYNNAKRNTLAQTRKWFMNYAQASSRDTQTNALVGGKLAVSDCSQITDGAAAVVLVSEDYLKNNQEGNNYPIIKGYGHRVAPMQFSKKMEDASSSEYLLPWTRIAVEDAYRRARMTVKDIDVFETHDCFTSSEYVAISCFGLTKPGMEYEAIENGSIAFDGKTPINPSGGLIGCGHPVGASGVRMLLDLYKQTTNTAGNYQINNARNGMMLNIGGSATTNYVFIVGIDDEKKHS